MHGMPLSLNRSTSCVSPGSVIFLRTALGSAAVPQPAIDLGSAFGALGDALGFGPLNPPFTPYEVRVPMAFNCCHSKRVPPRSDLAASRAGAFAHNQLLRVQHERWPSHYQRIVHLVISGVHWPQNDITFLLGAFLFEDVGVTAYKVRTLVLPAAMDLPWALAA